MLIRKHEQYSYKKKNVKHLFCVFNLSIFAKISIKMKSNRIVIWFIYVFVLLLLCFTSDKHNEWIILHWGQTVSNISDYIFGNNKVNALLSLASIFVIIFASFKNLTDYYRKWHIGGVVLAIDLLIILSTKYWTWYNSLFGIKWYILLITAITLPVLLSLLAPTKCKRFIIRCANKIKENIKTLKYNKDKQHNLLSNKKSTQKDNRLFGFCTDIIDNNTTDHNIRQPYADLIVKKAIATASKEAFAIGISGDWGSGKTLFLKHIEDSIKEQQKTDDTILAIKFQPWESSDSRQIIIDFFNTLCENIAPSFSALKKPMIKYAELLTMADAPNWLISLSNFLDKKKQLSINQLKTQISKYLEKIECKIFILIDDIDRLDEQEIYETLKLIRNTADFSNIIYIVSYDKKYICEQLTEYGIKSSKLYIEKIFPLEIKLQSPEPHFQSRCLIESISQMINDPIIPISIAKMLYYYEDIINDIIKTYRQAKRFARQLALNLEAIKENQLYDEISIEDFFLLELLYYHNPDLYNTLKNNPKQVLVAIEDKKYDIRYFTLRDGIDGSKESSKKPFPYKGDAIDAKSIIILKQLFDKQQAYRKTYQLAYIESYYKYFSFGISFDQISQTEFQTFLNGTNDIDTQVDNWCSNGKQDSLYGLTISHSLSDDSFECKRYISVVLALGKNHTNSISVKKLFSSAFMATKYNKNLLTDLRQYLYSEIKKYIYSFNHIQEYVQYAQSLSKIFHDEYYHSQRTGDEGFTLIGSCENAKSLLINNIESFLAKNPNTADNLFDSEYAIHTLVRASSISFDEDGLSTSVVFDFLLKYFSEHKGHNKHKAETFFKIDVSDSPTDDEINDRQTKQDMILSQMFSNRENYLKIIDTCFDN